MLTLADWEPSLGSDSWPPDRHSPVVSICQLHLQLAAAGVGALTSDDSRTQDMQRSGLHHVHRPEQLGYSLTLKPNTV